MLVIEVFERYTKGEDEISHDSNGENDVTAYGHYVEDDGVSNGHIDGDGDTADVHNDEDEVVVVSDKDGDALTNDNNKDDMNNRSRNTSTVGDDITTYHQLHQRTCTFETHHNLSSATSKNMHIETSRFHS